MRSYTVVMRVLPTGPPRMSEPGSRVGLRIEAQFNANSPTEAAETMLAAARAYWPAEWKVGSGQPPPSEER